MQDRHEQGYGLEVELGFAAEKHVGGMAEGAGELADAVMDLVPCHERVVEAGSVGVAVVGDRPSLGVEALGRGARFGVGGELPDIGVLVPRRLLEPVEFVEAGPDLGDMPFDRREGLGLAPVLGEDRVEGVEAGGGERCDGGPLAELAKALDEVLVAGHVERTGVGSRSRGDVRLPVPVELVHRALRERGQQLGLPRLDREQLPLEAAPCLDQRLALVRHGGQVGRVEAVLRQHRAGLGEHGLRPLPPFAQGVERRGRFGAVCRQRVRPFGPVPDLPADPFEPGMEFEPRGDEFLRARRQRRLPGERLRLCDRLAVAEGMERPGPGLARLPGPPPSSATRTFDTGRVAALPRPPPPPAR